MTLRSINPWNSSLPEPMLVPQFRGNWSATNFELSDVTLYNKGLYIAVQPTIASDNPETSNKWQLIAGGPEFATLLADAIDKQVLIEASITAYTNQINALYAAKTEDLNDVIDNANEALSSYQVEAQSAMLALNSSLNKFNVDYATLQKPVTATGPEYIGFNNLQFAPGSIAGQNKFVGVGNIANGVLSGLNNFGVYLNNGRPFSEGKFTFRVAGGTGFAVYWGTSPDGTKTRYAVWSGGGSVEAGAIRINDSAGNSNAVAQRGATAAPNEDYFVEVNAGPVFAGSTFNVRVWGISQSRPGPQITVAYEDGTITDGTPKVPLLDEGPIVLASLNDNAPQFKSLSINDYNNHFNYISARTTVIGGWFSRFEGGVNTLATVSSGSALWQTVSKTSGVAVTMAVPTGMSQRPVLASRFRVAGTKVWSNWVRTAVPGTGGPGSIVRTDPINGLDPTKTYETQIVFNIHESDLHWVYGSGFCLVDIFVAEGGNIAPTDVSGLPVVEFVGDSITAGVVALYDGVPPEISTPSNLCSEQSYGYVLSDLMGFVPVINGYGGTAVTHGGSGGVPKAVVNSTTYMNHRFNKEYYPRRPDYVFVMHGTNDNNSTDSATFKTQYRDLLTTKKALNPSALVIGVVPPLQYFAAEIEEITTQLAFPFIPTAGLVTQADTVDGTHPSVAGAIKFANGLKPRAIAVGIPSKQ